MNPLTEYIEKHNGNIDNEEDLRELCGIIIGRTPKKIRDDRILEIFQEELKEYGVNQIDKLSGNTKEFAEACFDTNSISELQEPHSPDDADPYDCAVWDITADDWAAAIEAALSDKRRYKIDKSMEEKP